MYIRYFAVNPTYFHMPTNSTDQSMLPFCVAEMEFVNLFQEKKNKNHAAFVFTQLSSFLLFWPVALPTASVSAYPHPPSVSIR